MNEDTRFAVTCTTNLVMNFNKFGLNYFRSCASMVTFIAIGNR